MSTAYSTQATYKGTPHSSPCLKGQGHPAAFWVKEKYLEGQRKYDESPNHTRRWCEDTCANMMRVRRFREKKRAHDFSPPLAH
ncbi:CGNR zinc finger domain-containing protein [Ktedonobacter racemifer]|uniref:Zinc finger CGNR domain-containing protein n=1 Tax=Ktedonobacter racemifer DSM 44963 TaxID=485913 RepID=D6TZ79_KTERA|nr:CGNR zinc finger domain-containing protein [Ktedonobacter racemifer]EFH81869.1 protein of unknown function DUF1470 [Ktedonobacter racemifer DSM 44963]